MCVVLGRIDHNPHNYYKCYSIFNSFLREGKHMQLIICQMFLAGPVAFLKWYSDDSSNLNLLWFCIMKPSEEKRLSLVLTAVNLKLEYNFLHAVWIESRIMGSLTCLASGKYQTRCPITQWARMKEWPNRPSEKWNIMTCCRAVWTTRDRGLLGRH